MAKVMEMKVILYMAITINGYIARENGSNDWTSEEDWAGFFNILKRCGNGIIGRNTYDIMPPEQFTEDVLYVVMTKREPPKKKVPNVVFTDKSPKEVLDFLKDKGFKEVCVGGGGQINTSFIRDGLIDEIYLDVEPVILGRGIQLFSLDDFEANLELLEVNKLNKNTIQLHYKIKK